MDKRERAQIFRTRLRSRMEQNGITRSGLARTCQADRSTIAQLLSEDEVRLPNAQLAAECAVALGVSADWLLGLSERSETAADLIDTSINITDAGRTPADEQIEAWHREAHGYKIRHVPVSLPDVLKTKEVIDFEYSAFSDKMSARDDFPIREDNKWVGRLGSDYEICISRELVESLANGEGYWRGLSKSARVEQIEHLVSCCRELYPSLRVYLYDSKVLYSAPITIFGPLLAAVYIGRYYMVFREKRQVSALTDHFDQLVRDCETDARSAANVIENML